MKKFTITAMVIGVALLLAVPAMAVDISWDGAIRVRGYLEKNSPMNDNADDYNAFYDMRLRTNWTLAVSDNMNIRTRWRALNTIGGGGATEGTGGADNFDWERAFMTIRSPYGTFQFGRMGTGSFGNTFLDNDGDVYRLNYVTKLADKVTLVVTAQKPVEGDGGFSAAPPAPGANWQISDQDFDVYGFALVYPTENWTLGSLQLLLRQRQGGLDADRYSVNPYFTGKFGNLGLLAEAQAYFGSSDGIEAASGDYEAYGLMVEANYDIGMANLMGGFAYITGDDDPADGDVENLALGDDWEKFFLLFGSTGDSPAVLGGVGNFSNTGGNTGGFWTIYAGADTNLTESFNVGLSAAWCTVNETAAGIDDDAGIELNLRGTWQIYDNLSYSFIAAYLMAGDYWEDSAEAADPGNGNDDDPWALFHVLQMSF